MIIHDYLTRKMPVEDDLCFVIMPFDKELEPVFAEAITPVVEALHWRCRRADTHLASSPIVFDIFDDILRARVVIADLTGSNPNVLYELGIAHAIKRDVILIRRAGSEVPFNLVGMRCFEYEDSLKGLLPLKSFLRMALTTDALANVSSGPNKHALRAALGPAFRRWREGKTVLLPVEDFLEMVLGLDALEPTEEEIAFLCHAAAHFGQLMKRMVAAGRTNRTAIQGLVALAAAGPTTREPWRAAAMLEHCDPALVGEVIAAYDGPILNEDLFPSGILKNETAMRLAAALEDASISAERWEKLATALRQIRAEFRDQATPSPKRRSAEG